MCTAAFAVAVFFLALLCGMPFSTENVMAGSAVKASDGFIKIKGGKFTMGSPKKEAEREKDGYSIL